MNKISLVSFIGLMVINPLMAAGVDVGTTDATCNNETLETYEGDVNLQANWDPNTINIKWYNNNNEITPPDWAVNFLN